MDYALTAIGGLRDPEAYSVVALTALWILSKVCGVGESKMDQVPDVVNAAHSRDPEGLSESIKQAE
jgi:hypothetical protein